MLRTLFLNPPSFEGFDGGAGARYQARREIRSYWYPTWLAQPAALVPGNKLVDAPPADLTLGDVAPLARSHDLVVLHTSSPTFAGDVKVAEALKAENPAVMVGFVGPKVAVQPGRSLRASTAIDFVAREEFDFTIAEVAEGLLLASEPVWNRRYIRYVQIDVPEKLSIEGRPAFYDATGAYRDMVVTHLFQVMGFVAMEPPVSLSAGHLRDETVEVFEALKPLDVRHVVRGQYAGYRCEPGVAAGSDTETMVAVRAEVENWRRQGVPFYLRSGKSMGASRQVITLGFQRPPLNMFCARLPDAVRRFNEIVIDFADPGSISIEFLAMIPGAELSLGRTKMTFSYKNSFATANALERYERLILLAMAGEQSLFTRSDGLERLWEISAPLLDDPPPVEPYEPGSWGPPSTDRLIAPFRWHLPES